MARLGIAFILILILGLALDAHSQEPKPAGGSIPKKDDFRLIFGVGLDF